MLSKTPLKDLTQKHYLLVVAILIVNLAQSFFTGLHTDEGYYWMYSQNLAWGYFDHPPMVALLIHLGDSLFHNELGVRLFTVLFSTITTILIIKETGEKEDVWFLGLFLLSFPLFHTHLGGFLALPDSPLVLFTFLFFIIYRRFIKKQDLKTSLLLSVIIAAMIYSKYHAFLVIGLTVLSNLSLLKNKYFWGIVLVSAILLMPHFWWQFENNFPSFRYHFHDRTKPFQLKYAVDNILNQLIILGPLTFPIIIWAITRFRIKQSTFNRSIIFNIAGFFTFLFILSFKNRIEAHWTVAITPLIMITAYPQIAGHPGAKLWFKRLALPALILFLVFRFYIAADFIPGIGNTKSAFHKRAETSEQIRNMSHGRQVASFNNFAFPGIYEFYTGNKALHLASPSYRYCQFDLIQNEQKYDGDSLFIIVPDRMDPSSTINLVNGKKVDTRMIANFQSLKGMQLKVEETNKNASALNVRLRLSNNSGKTIRFKHSSNPVIGFMQDKKELYTVPLKMYADKIDNNQTMDIETNILLTRINAQLPLIIYTQTKEKNRGEMISIVNFE